MIFVALDGKLTCINCIFENPISKKEMVSNGDFEKFGVNVVLKESISKVGLHRLSGRTLSKATALKFILA